MRICIIAEGQSEMQFIDSVVSPYVYSRNSRIEKIWPINSGGVGKTESIGYQKIKRVITTQMRSDNSAVYTTMFDYYRFPKVNIPGFTYEPYPDPYQKAKVREDAFRNAIYSEEKLASFNDNITFHPFLMLHEYETLMFCDLSKLGHVREGNDAAIRKLMKDVEHIENIELINDNQLTAPSKRIANVIKGYAKPSMGLAVTKSIGIEMMLTKCQHFKEWIDWMIGL